MQAKETFASSFDKHYTIDEATGCHVWQRGRDAYGYGRLQIDGLQERAHRFAWKRAHGPIPPGCHLGHHCDNPPCCNPEHLFLGTNTDNRRDSVRKKRHAHGERQGLSRLNSVDVERIRDIYRIGGNSQREIAQHLDMSQSQIGRILRGVCWGHV